MKPSAETLSLKECAERLGVHYMTAYRYVRIGRLPASKQAGEWRVSLTDFDEFVAKVSDRPVRGGVPWATRLEARLRAGDDPGSWQVVEAAMVSGLTPEQIYLDVITPAMQRIGEAWHTGDARIAEEHRASAIAARLVGKLGSRFRVRGRRKGKVVVGAPEGERHAIPVAVVADMLRSGGFEVVELGADLPTPEFVAAAVAEAPLTAVAVSVSHAAAEQEAHRLIGALRAALDTTIIVGGGAVASLARATALGADLYASDGAEAVALAKGLVSS